VHAEWRDVIPSGYKYPDEYFNLENGLPSNAFGPKSVDGVYLMHCVVKSDYVENVLKNKICLENSQFDTGKDLFESWEKSGFFPVLETQNQTLNVTIERNAKNDGFYKYEGHFQAGGYVDGPENSSGFFKRVDSFTSEVVVNISNVVFKDSNIYMDIDGSVQYQYHIDGNIQGSPPGGWTEENTAEFQSFRNSVKDGQKFEETRREFKALGAKSSFELDSDGKTIRFVLAVGEIVMTFEVMGVLPSAGATDPATPGVTQQAQQNPGEDSGVSVPAAVVIGVIGGGVALLGAAAASGKENPEDDKKKKSYKMYVQKDFGDAIKKGCDPVPVRARMTEIDGAGIEVDRNDLTAKIKA
jgi:hypothetical protein